MEYDPCNKTTGSTVCTNLFIDFAVITSSSALDSAHRENARTQVVHRHGDQLTNEMSEQSLITESTAGGSQRSLRW